MIELCSQVLVLRSKMTCTKKMDYSEEKVRRFNLTLSYWADCAQNQDTGQDVWSKIRVQWMTITFLCLVMLHMFHNVLLYRCLGR